MEHYTLQEDEVILYHGIVSLLPDGKKQKTSQNKKTEVESILTNLNFVFITKVKQLLKKEMVNVETYSISEVKFYRDNPHIIKKGKVVELYLKSCEKFIEFPNTKETKTFSDTALRLVSGKSKFVRSVKNAQKEIQETNEALNIDIVDIASKAGTIAANVAIEASGAKNATRATKLLGMIARATKKEPKQPLITDEHEEI